MLLPFLPCCITLRPLVRIGTRLGLRTGRAQPRLLLLLSLLFPATGICSRSWRATNSRRRSLMSLGWRPRAAFTFSCSRTRGPPMFFMNMYFYTGVQVMGRHHHPTSSTPPLRHLPVQRSFEMIHCNYDGETQFSARRVPRDPYLTPHHYSGEKPF